MAALSGFVPGRRAGRGGGPCRPSRSALPFDPDPGGPHDGAGTGRGRSVLHPGKQGKASGPAPVDSRGMGQGPVHLRRFPGSYSRLRAKGIRFGRSTIYGISATVDLPQARKVRGWEREAASASGGGPAPGRFTCTAVEGFPP